ncbi:Ig-like domain-containing protein [Bacillus sp. ISL-51]|uniref:Ig-like domain-containing protein n=1 Tax=Bacteria TaxID=2 RepID=UPI001BEB2096|nr:MULTISPECIES: Ig-like domain-containing protein [Bacteria]MBT2575239.1 Ig-like domain-containing protein [Bacillus sp. ISL-51]MBT2633532.1 Ig-like domain-containing protein [Bacillus sp. ISL-26]MBT2714032.1 Ig-like domain-containing protein [Pseudomonas sp. ISL-88]
MNVKKTVVSALSISALALAVGGAASAKEINTSPVPKTNSIVVSGPIKAQDYSITLKAGETRDISNPVAYYYSSDSSGVASVTQGGVVKGVSKGSATITLLKQDRSVLGKVYVTVQ